MPATCRYSRLTFKRDIIEPLKDNELYRVETPVGVFQMTKKDFYKEFKNVAKSKAYCKNGLYNYASVPKKAIKFLVGGKKQTTPDKYNIKEYKLPSFLDGVCTEATYKRWLHRKAMAHFKRDTKRGIKDISCSSYKRAIHQAVLNGGQHDAYTGEKLDWTLISKYNNDESKQGKRKYKKMFWNLPTVDHFDDDYKNPTFKICAWRTNDCKNDLTVDELIKFCKIFLNHQNK